MSLEQVKVRVSDLIIGMYVSQLDRPWSQTPFPLQGFLLRTPADVQKIRSYCDYVFIDLTKGVGTLDKAGAPVSINKKVVDVAQKPSKNLGLTPLQPKSDFADRASPAKPIIVKRNVYSEVVPLNVEIKQAERALKTLRGHFILASKLISKGRQIDYPALRKSVDDMVESVIRCPDAFTWLMKLRIKDQYSHDHSMRTALWATQFARYIGLAKDEISVLTLGTLLKDIGKIHLPASLLNKEDRSSEQQEEYQKFVDYGVKMLKDRQVEPRVISVVRHHCERNDGSGFPQGLTGSKIPFLARIAGVATFYDLLSTPRPGATTLSPSKAISTLYNMRGKEFQDDLVVQFIQSVGLYPTGTLVEMTTGDIGVVVEQDPKSRLTPQIAVVPHLRDNSPAKNYFLINLKDEDEARKSLLEHGYGRAANVQKLAIARDLQFSGHNIDMEAVAGLFMSAVEEKVTEAVNDSTGGGFFSKFKRSMSKSGQV